MHPYPSTPNHPTSKSKQLSLAINKLFLNKIISPSSATAHSNIEHLDIPSDSSLSSPSLPTLHANSQTMKKYASQRSDKVPLRQPALFPTSLNFSQQTIYLFDSNEDNDQTNLTFYLNDLLREPPLPSQNHQTQNKKNLEPCTNQPSLYPSALNNNTETKSKKFGLNALPISFPTPPKFKPTGPSFFRTVKPNPSATTPKAPLVDTKFSTRETNYSLKIASPVPDLSPFSERKQLLSFPTELDSAGMEESSQIGMLPTPLEAISEQSNPSSPILSFDQPPTALLPTESYQQEQICPQIDMVLTTSPFFNHNHSTLSPMSTQEPETPMRYSRVTTGALFPSPHALFSHRARNPIDLRE